MPKKVCEHMSLIASMVRPEHKIYGCHERNWLKEIKEGKDIYSSALNIDENEGDSVFFARRGDKKNRVMTYINDISFLSYHCIKTNVEKCNCENVEDLKKRINELESSSSTQLVLRRGAETEKKDLEVVKRSLEIRIGDLERNNWSLQSTNDGLKEDLRKRDKDIEWGKNQLALAQRGEREKQTRIDELTRQFVALQIENNRNKDKIKDLKGELGQSQEEYLNQKISIKEEKLETLAQQLGINGAQITNLRNAYQQLIEARRNFNQANINAANGNINNLRAALAVNPANRQKICRKCEKLVKLEIELNQVYQQQFEARQEVPPHN